MLSLIGAKSSGTGGGAILVVNDHISDQGDCPSKF